MPKPTQDEVDWGFLEEWSSEQLNRIDDVLHDLFPELYKRAKLHAEYGRKLPDPLCIPLVGIKWYRAGDPQKPSMEEVDWTFLAAWPLDMLEVVEPTLRNLFPEWYKEADDDIQKMLNMHKKQS